jgi:hypothetical protein
MSVNRSILKKGRHIGIGLLQFNPSIYGAKPFLQSLELGLPHPLTRRRVCPQINKLTKGPPKLVQHFGL